MWGATLPRGTVGPGLCISIHAPRVGSDAPPCRRIRPRRQDFNPRSPCGERHLDDEELKSKIRISIHAPRVGSDLRDVLRGLQRRDFNPRSPCGERRKSAQKYMEALYISIHAPRVGSDRTIHDGLRNAELFQSTLPVWGATWTPLSYRAMRSRFQSTLPVWGATMPRRVFTDSSRISIHAPRVGSDVLPDKSSRLPAIFQSTLPVWGATQKTSPQSRPARFQSTLPVWGATRRYRKRLRRPADFNPRSPCGERQQRCTDFSFASSAKRVFFCDILQIGRHLQGIGRKRRGDFLSRSVRTSRGKYGCLAFAFRESGGLRENRRFYSQSVLFSFRIDCQGSRIAGCPFRGP